MGVERRAAVPEVEETLRDMAAHSEPLVRQLPRRPGQKEERWVHTVGRVVVEDLSSPVAEPASETREPLSQRVQRLEEQMAALAAELRELKGKLGE